MTPGYPGMCVPYVFKESTLNLFWYVHMESVYLLVYVSVCINNPHTIYVHDV